MRIPALAAALVLLAACDQQTDTAETAAPASDTAVAAQATAPTETPIAEPEVAEAPEAEPAPATPVVAGLDPKDGTLGFSAPKGGLGLEAYQIVDVMAWEDVEAGGWAVFLQLDAEAATALLDLTADNVGEDMTVMVEGEEVLEMPLQSAIGGGGLLLAFADGDVAFRVADILTPAAPTE